MISAFTFAPVIYGVPIVVFFPSSTSKTLSKTSLSPGLYSPFIFSIERTVPRETLYCFPPVFITANSIGHILHEFYVKCNPAPKQNLVQGRIFVIIPNMQTKIMERYFFFCLLFFTLIFTFFIFRPFWIVLVLGASFAVILQPIQKWLKKNKFSNWFASFVTVLIFLLLVCGPLFGIGIVVFNQSQNVFHLITGGNNIAPFIEKLNGSINDFLPNGFSFNLSQKASDFISLISNNLGQIFSTTLYTFFSFILMILSIFYFLKDGSEWKKSLLALSPMSDADEQKILGRLKQTVNGVFKGYLLISLIQGTLTSIGLFIFGVPNPALWGVVAAITSLIPTVGTGLVSIPAIIFLYATGHLPQAIGLLAWSMLFVGLIDNFLNPMIVGKRIKIPAFLILFSVLGGIVLLGPVGVLIGPLAVSLLYALVSMYQNEFKQNAIL